MRDTRIARSDGKGEITTAWLHDETDRYPHFVLGGRFEAAGISAKDRNGRRFTLKLPEDAVFEDRIVRMVDLDDDGRTELAVVISRKGVGSSLALIGVRKDGLRILAETMPNGLENRWLNPSGTGRFLGGSKRQIAIVRRPHLDATLELYEYDGGQLRRVASAQGYSTHRNGSRHQRLFAVLTGENGAPDRLAVPTQRRDAIAVLDFSQGGNPEIARFALQGRADGDFAARRSKENWQIKVPLEGGGQSLLTVSA